MAGNAYDPFRDPPPTRFGCSGLLFLLTLLVLAIASPYLTQQIMYRATLGRQQADVEVARKAIGEFKNTTESFRLVAQSIGPSVVHIDTEQIIRGARPIGDEMAYFFAPRRLSGQGSGVIIDKSGYILTNFHVIAQTSGLRVRLSDGREIREVTIIGADAATDLAVLKIDADSLIPAVWGDSDQVQVGDWVLAIGNPYGLDRTVTAGIISAKGRHGIGQNLYQDFLQTDAAVNPGNSGGPLVNLAGEIVGINTAIVGEAYQGISFAIPSRMAREVFDQLRKSGSVARGWLGVQPQDLTPELADQLGVRGTTGAVIARVVPDSPADQAGLKDGDVIIKWDGAPVRDASDLTLKVAGTAIHTSVTALIIRGREEQKVEIKVGTRPTQLPQLK